jgi:hypothetical protein
MAPRVPSIRLVRWLQPDAQEFKRYIRTLRAQKPPSRGQRQAGEIIGRMGEKAVRHWLSARIPLQPERVLSWEARLPRGQYCTLYREIDAVRRLDQTALCLFEIKIAAVNRLRQGYGLGQLGEAVKILASDPRWRTILRLVYVGDDAVPVKNGLPVLDPQDDSTPLGVIWVPPTVVEEAACELGLCLPDRWQEAEFRSGSLTSPEGTAPVANNAVNSLREPAEGPIAEALRRAGWPRGLDSPKHSSHRELPAR